MKRKLKRWFIIFLAVLSFLLGLAGLVLPLLQGWFFLALGIILLSIISPNVRAWTERNTIKYPKIHKVVKEIEDWVTRKVGDV